jgi:hypothetical protein
MENEDNQDRKIPEPLHIIMSPALFYSIKSNQGLIPEENLSDVSLEEFEKFKELWKDVVNKLNKHDDGAFGSLSKLFSMWGYNRRYCSMTGKPIIGKPRYIEGRMVSEEYFQSYQITERLHKRDIAGRKGFKRGPSPDRSRNNSQ